MSKVEFIAGEKIDVDKIRSLERMLDVEFPLDYVKCVSKNNGAYLFPNAFRLEDRIESINNLYNVEEIHCFFDERLPSKVIPFARDAGDNLICFDFKNSNKVRILFWDHEKELSYNEDGFSYICDTFSELVEMLFEYEE